MVQLVMLCSLVEGLFILQCATNHVCRTLSVFSGHMGSKLRFYSEQFCILSLGCTGKYNVVRCVCTTYTFEMNGHGSNNVFDYIEPQGGRHREDLLSLPDHRLHGEIQDLRHAGPPQTRGSDPLIQSVCVYSN